MNGKYVIHTNLPSIIQQISHFIIFSSTRDLDAPFYLHCYNHFIPLGFIFRLSFLGFNFFKPLITYCKSITYLFNAIFGFYPDGGIYFIPSEFRCTLLSSLL